MTDNLSTHIARTLVSGISPSVLEEDAESSELGNARELCRSGNPFPLIAIQWPELLIDDPSEAKYFGGAIGDELNPCLRLDNWQRMFLLAVFDDSIREIFCKSSTGVGKGAASAIACCLMYDVYETLRLSICGPTFSHAFSGLYAEVVDWFGRMRHPQPRSDSSTTIASSRRHYIDIINPQRGKGGEEFSGQHSRDPRGRIVVFDEATSAEDTWIENAYKNAYKVICLANPRTIMGFFRNAFKPLGADKENKTGICMGTLGKRLCITVGGPDCMNVKHGRVKTPIAPPSGITIDGTHYPPGERIPPHHFELVKPLIPGQMDLTQFQAACSAQEKWKSRCYAFGLFPDEDPEAQVILSSWLQRHHNHYHALLNEQGCPVNAFGLDVAHSLEGDESSIAAGSSAGCAAIVSERYDNYTAIAEWLLRYATSEHGIDLLQGLVPVCIDYGGGYGAGVGDWLESAGVWVVRSVPAARAEVMPEVYSNMRTEMWSLLGRRLNPADPCGVDPFAIPEIPGLVEDMLHALRKWNADMTRHGLVSKLDVKQSLGRSPDKGDSLALLFQAVRTMEGLDDWFRATGGDLLVYPHEPSKGTKPPANPRNVNQQVADVLAWAQNRGKKHD